LDEKINARKVNSFFKIKKNAREKILNFLNHFGFFNIFNSGKLEIDVVYSKE